MGLLTITVIAVGLAMDAFAVSIVEGGAYKKLHLLHALRLAVLFGLFQGVMPVAGYFFGIGVKNYIEGYDHWIAFILLSAIGLKMLYESRKIKPSKNEGSGPGIMMLLGLSVATSIDALSE